MLVVAATFYGSYDLPRNLSCGRERSCVSAKASDRERKDVCAQPKVQARVSAARLESLGRGVRLRGLKAKAARAGKVADAVAIEEREEPYEDFGGSARIVGGAVAVA